MGESELTFLIHHPSKPKITQLDITIPVQKNIAWLEISMQNFLWILALFELFFIDSIIDLCRLRPPMTMV